MPIRLLIRNPFSDNKASCGRFSLIWWLRAGGCSKGKVEGDSRNLRECWHVCSVCVCTIHQNVVLMLNAIKLDEHSHELMGIFVCDQDSKECMVHRCPYCPDSAGLSNYLLQQLCMKIMIMNMMVVMMMMM